MLSMIEQLSGICKIKPKPKRVCRARDRYLKHLSITKWMTSEELRALLCLGSIATVSKFMNSPRMVGYIEKKIVQRGCVRLAKWRRLK